ncbi:hypothetical protein [Mesobacillus boroniphilus]|nr:hypothetical protein [Mesobacillus boroniphilus]
MPPEFPPFRGGWTGIRANPVSPKAQNPVQSQERRKKKCRKAVDFSAS